MKGDFSRFVFQRRRYYAGVLMQQGRVELDSDWNDLVRIQAQSLELTTRDLAGPTGGPADGTGFQLTVQDGTLQIGAGRYYVDGLLCDNPEAVPLGRQPFPPGGTPPGQAGSYLAYLDVWPRSVNAIQDPDIREPALGGPDTTVRWQYVWQVRLIAGDSVSPAPADPGEIEVRAQSGARVGNRLYLVEVHQPGILGTEGLVPPTWKWSRTNGSVDLAVTAWTQDNFVTVDTFGVSLDLLVAAGDWLEFVDDTIVFANVAAPLWQVVSLDPAESMLTLASSASAAPSLVDPSQHPFLLRWDQKASSGAVLDNGAVVMQPDVWIELEDGIEVRFKAGGAYGTGDYWDFPTRTDTGVDWPRDSRGEPLPRPKNGIDHHYAPLALLQYAGDGTWQVTEDRRQLFLSAVELTQKVNGGDLAKRFEELEARLAQAEQRLATLEGGGEKPGTGRKKGRAD